MIDSVLGVEIILDGPNPALWDGHTKREVTRFLRKRGKDIVPKDLSRLMRAILNGPPRTEYREMGEDEWAQLCDHAIWLRLAKLKQSGAKLSKYAEHWFTASERRYPWKLQKDGSEEFSFFMTTGWGSPDKDPGKPLGFVEMSIEQFSEWANKQTGRWDSDGGWVLFCDEQPELALKRLEELGGRGEWPTAPWYDALSRYSRNEKLTSRHHVNTAQALIQTPDPSLTKFSLMAARWMENVQRKLRKKVFWNLWRKIWNASQLEPPDGDLDIDMTLNHANGILASVLMDALAEIHPTVNTDKSIGLPKQLRPYFDMVARGEGPAATLGRTRLASNLLYLFSLDRNWAIDALISHMDPESPTFERSLWEGYLWSPRISEGLIDYIKPLFFQILNKLELIPEQTRGNAVQLFVIAAVPPDRGISSFEAKAILYSLSSGYLVDVAHMLRSMLRDAGEKASTLWVQTVGPWIHTVWPAHQEAKSPALSESLARMVMDTREAFPDAVATIRKFLVPEEWTGSLHHLGTTDLPERYPEASLTLIDCLFGENMRTDRHTVLKLLDTVARADARLTTTEQYNALRARAA